MRQGGQIPFSVVASIGLAVALAAIAILVPVPSAPATTASVVATPAPTAATRATNAPATSARSASPAFAMTMSDAELTTAAASGFPQTISGVTVSDPVVSVGSASVRLVAKAAVFFGTTQFVMTATPLITDGRIAVRVDSATLAGVSLPEDTKAAIANSMQTTIARLVPASVRVTSIGLAVGSLTVQGTRN